MARRKGAQTAVDGETAGVIAPPPLLFAAALALSYGLHWLLPLGLGGALTAWLRLPLGFGLLVAALLGAFLALRDFRRLQTPAEPWKPTRRLTTGGIYRFTCNPMYLALLLLLAAAGLLADWLWALLALPFLAVALHRGVVLREERYLTRRFGAEYEAYRGKVRRWL